MSEFHDPDLRQQLGRLSGPYPDDNAAFAAWQRRVGQARRRRAMAWTTAAALSLIVGTVAVAALQSPTQHSIVSRQVVGDQCRRSPSASPPPSPRQPIRRPPSRPSPRPPQPPPHACSRDDTEQRRSRRDIGARGRRRATGPVSQSGSGSSNEVTVGTPTAASDTAGYDADVLARPAAASRSTTTARS